MAALDATGLRAHITTALSDAALELLGDAAWEEITEVAGAEGTFVPASAKIDGERIVVHAETVKSPKAVRYGWANNPKCTLYNRADLPAITARTLVLQCREDIIAPTGVGEYVSAKIPGSRFMQLEATGHCPNLSAPAEVTAAIRSFV